MVCLEMKQQPGQAGIWRKSAPRRRAELEGVVRRYTGVIGENA
jgi:hypothetical protein